MNVTSVQNRSTPSAAEAGPRERESASVVRQIGPGGVGLIALVWLYLLARTAPHAGSDHGVWISVTERLLAGDALYAGVVENKDPLFFVPLALGRLVTPYGDLVVELIWMLLAAVSTLLIARRVGLGAAAAAVAGLGMAPLVLTGTAYYPGYTHLPGVATTLAVLGAILGRRAVVAGVLLGLLAFLKLTLLPVAVAGTVVVLLVRRDGRGAMRASLAGAATGAAILAVLALRGELGAYLEIQVSNLTYSEGAFLESRWGPVAAHVEAVVNPGAQVTILATVLLLAFTIAWRGWRVGLPEREARILWHGTAATLAAGLVVIASTGLWEHHGQVLYVAGVLGAVLAVAVVAPLAGTRRLASVVTLGLVGVFLGGMPSYVTYLAMAGSFTDRVASLARLSPEAQAVLELGDTGSYARVGSNDDPGHAYGLRDWDLACARFHQYPLDSAEVLEDVAACLPNADVILVTGFARPVAGEDEWNTYIEVVNAMLAAEYTCTAKEFGRICVRD